jgi:hypothetical protein
MKLNKAFIYLLVNSFLCIYFFGLNYVYLVYSILIYLIIKYLNNNMIISLVLGLIAIILKFISFYDNYIILDDFNKAILTTNYFNFLNNLYFRIKINIYHYTGYRIQPDASQYTMNTSLLSEISDCIKNFFNYFSNNIKLEVAPQAEKKYRDIIINADNIVDFLQENEENEEKKWKLIEESLIAQQKAKEEVMMKSAFSDLKQERKMRIQQEQQLNKEKTVKNKK